MRVPRRLLLVTAALAACGGGGDGPGTTNPPDNTLSSVTIEPQSTSVGVGATTTLSATARNAGGTAISGASFTFTSSDQSKATVTSGGVVSGVAVGAVTITATATRDGITRSGTANVEITEPDGPIAATVAATPANAFAPPTVEINVGEAVRWNFGTVAHNVLFRANVGRPADIAAQSGTSVVRTFRAAGDFDYDCTLHAGMTGTVVVR